MKNIFEVENTTAMINRINQLNSNTQAKWGKMSVDKMLAHCNKVYDLVYDDNHPKAKGIKKLLLKWLVKPIVVSEKPYKKNSRTAPEFIIANERDFEKEKTRLVDYLNKTQQLGATHFDDKLSHSFGKLSITEWNNLFYKHLDHHLEQFGV